jgi:predicted XRE-type DNA-binding protein
MAKRDPQRTQKLRIAVRYLLERDCLAKGNQSRLAEHFKVSRQRVHQIVVEERQHFRQPPAVR